MSATRSVTDLARLLAPEALADALASALRECRYAGEPVTLDAVRPTYLRLKPGRSALLGLALTWRGAAGVPPTMASLYVGDDAPQAAAKARTRRLLDPLVGPPIAEIPALPGLFASFPNDRVLKGLSAAADARRLGNRLAGEHGPWAADGWRVRARHTTVTAVRWKPERRAVLRAELAMKRDATNELSAESVWVRVYPADELAAREQGWRAAATVSGLATPAVRWRDGERGLLVIEHVEGRAFDAPGDDDWRALGDSLARLHGAPSPALPVRGDSDALEAATRTLAALSALSATHARRARALGDELARAAFALPAPEPAFVHGDLGADQLVMASRGVVLMDWDEAALADPHADYASLAADRAAAGDAEGAERAQALAADGLGSRLSRERLRWHLALAHARRALAPLQRGDRAWESHAAAALDRAQAALASSAPRRAVAATPDPERVTDTLAALLDRSRRRALPGVDGRDLVLGAVWPVGPGAHARLEEAGRPGVPVLWLACDAEGTIVHAFPEDPSLPALAPAIAAGHVPAGHRLGRRAALRSANGAHFLYLRPTATRGRAWKRVREAHVMLDAAGVPHASPAPHAHGWTSRAARGATWPSRVPTSSDLREAGAQLARVHRLGGDTAAPDALSDVIEAGRAQIALVALVDRPFARALGESLEAARQMPAESGTAAWTHGDLHPGQLVTGDETLWLDWERARAGEAEADLGNLAAHVAWEFGADARDAWRALADGYREAGGTWSHRRFVAHALATLARTRAIHSWRDGGRSRAHDSTRWNRWRMEVTSW